MKKLLIPAFCQIHMIALLWWTLPHSFGSIMIELLFDVVILRKLLVARCLFANKTPTSFCLAVTVNPISDCFDLFRVRLGKIPKSRMARWNNYAICTNPSSVFALGWMEFHR
jgi:hypothetical protein